MPEFDAGFVAAHAMRFRVGSGDDAPASTRCSFSAIGLSKQVTALRNDIEVTRDGLKNELDATRQELIARTSGEPRPARSDGRAKRQTIVRSRGHPGHPATARFCLLRQDIGAKDEVIAGFQRPP